jgi:hypothetical protein
MTKKGFRQREQKTTEVCPGLAHRTIRCATTQCPVYQGTQLQTRHLWENQRALCYNSPDCPVRHRTASGGAPDCLVCQRSNGYFSANGRLQLHSMCYSARQSQSSDRRCTGQSTVLVRCTTRQPEDPTCQSSNGRTLTAE